MFSFIRNIFRTLRNIIKAGDDFLDELNEKLENHHDDVQEAKKNKNAHDDFYSIYPEEFIDKDKKP